MTLEKLQAEMVTAMKDKNKARKDTISSLIGAVKKTAIDKKCKDNITEALVDEVILKEKKTVQEIQPSFQMSIKQNLIGLADWLAFLSS